MQNALALAAYMADVKERRDVPAALEAWEAAARPLTEHCQYWSCLFGEITMIPNEVRPMFIQAAFTNAWVTESLGRTADSIPIAKIN